MPFEGAVRSRVASWLEPWLREEPDAEIKLGFRRCQGTWTDLKFDPSKLDPLIEGSTRLAFSQVRVAQLSVQFNPWSWPNLLVAVTGFHVILVPRELDEENIRLSGDSDSKLEDDVSVDSIDPEGALLREVIENALKTAPSGSWLKSTLTEALLPRCQFQFYDTSFQVQFTGESKLCMLRSGKISLQLQFSEKSRVQKGTSSLLFDSRKQGLSLSCNAESLEFGIKDNGFVKIILSFKDPSVSTHFSNLKPASFDINFPSIDSSFSPLDVPVFCLLSNLFSEQTKSKRDGQILWAIAARRVSKLSKSPRVSWHKIVQMVMSWLSYVHAYELLLSLVGYPIEHTLKNCLLRLCRDLEFSRCVERQWKRVDELEKQLPAEAVSKARLIARKRVQLSLENSFSQSASLYTILKGRILILLHFIWNLINFLFRSVAVIMLLFLQLPPSELSSNSYKRFYIDVADFSLRLYPMTASCENSIENTSLERDIPRSGVPSFCFVLKSFFLGHVRDGIDRDLFLVLGGICIQFSPPLNVPPTDNELKLKKIPTFMVSPDENRSGSRVILQSEPANLPHCAVSSPDNERWKADVHAMIIETSLHELKSLCKMLGDEVERPFLLFELQKKFTYQNSDGVVGSILRCIATLGKLNIDLDTDSITFIVHLLGQILNSLQWVADIGKTSSDNAENPGNSEGELQLFAPELKMSLLKLMPLKHIQIGVMLSGCNIKISCHGLRHLNPEGWSLFSTDLSSVELSIWPASVDKLLELYPDLEVPASRGDFLWVKNLHLLEIPENELVNNFCARGRISHNTCMSLTVAASFEGFEGWEDNHKSQAIGPISMNIDASTSRQYLHSFYPSENACTLSLGGMTGKTDVFLNMDDLGTLFQVLEEVISAQLRISVDFDHAVVSNSREYITRLLSMTNGAMRRQTITQSKHKISPLSSMLFKVDTCIELGQFNLILSKSRKKYSTVNSTGNASSSNGISDANWRISIPKSLIQIYCEARNIKLQVNFSDIRSDLYKPEYHVNSSNDDALRKNHSVQHSGLLCKFGLPYIILNLSAECGQDSLSSTCISIPHSIFRFLAEIKLGKIFLGNQSMKNPLADHQCSGLRVLISGSEALHEIQFESQGGYFLIEMEKLVFFIQTARGYLLALTSLQIRNSKSSRKPHEHTEISTIGDQEHTETVQPTSSSEIFRWWFLKLFDLNVSHFYVIFANVDASGRVRHLIVEADFHFRFSSIEEKFSFDILKLIVLSMHLTDSSRSFESRIARDMPTDTRNCSTVESLTSNFERKIALHDGPSMSPPMYHTSYILEKVSASAVVEKTTLDENLPSLYFKSDWLGNGSISGFSLTISLFEIQMLMDLMAPLSRVSSKNSIKISKRGVGFQTQGSTNYSKIEIPDGATVVMKDLHQHLYIATEDFGGVPRVVSTLHYSLAGERALFRVNWHKGKSSLFSLTSLHEKDINGEPLNLNFSPGSGFVEVSRRGGVYALWKLTPYGDENYGNDDDVKFSKSVMSSGKAFYLVNYKNNSGIAFVDGVPEFVQKSGSPFKIKILHEVSPVNAAMESNIHGQRFGDIQRRYPSGVSLLLMSIKIEKISVTICHEISDAEDRFPLARGVIDNVDIIGQILPSKFRIMCTYLTGVDYFDVQINNWKQLIPHVETGIFLHSRRQADFKDFPERTPVHSHFKINQVIILLTELSLDILLFICERLDITGPYVLRKSIFRNSCKVENLSSLNVICHFGDDQDIVVGGKKVALVLLRHKQKIDQFEEVRSSVSVRAFKYGGFSTLPLNISLLDNQTFAWRTSIPSQKGPSFGINVSMQTGDGLSLSISPLLRIHNITGFPLVLRLNSPEKGSIAVLPLGIGDSLDDFMLLDGSDYSGDSDKAMLSLSQGDFMLSLMPDVSGISKKSKKEVSVDWSENMMTGNAVSLSGLFDKLSQRFKEAFGVLSVKSSLTTVSCPLTAESVCFSHMHFLIQITERDLPVIESGNSMFLPQKEIFISPTLQVFNLLETEILVVLSETYPDASVIDLEGIVKHETIARGSNAFFYANPLSLYFTVTLTTLNAKSKPVDASERVKKLQKQKFQGHFFDIELDFNGVKQSAYLRLSCGDKGVLEATIFSSFTLKNSTELSFFCFAVSQKPLSLEQNERCSSIFPPELGLFLPSNTTKSWLLKSNRVYIRLKEGKSSESLLDLDNLSGFTELKFESTDEADVSRIVKVGVSLKALGSKDFLPAQMVTIAPRYVISNESLEPIFFRQCGLENEADGITQLKTKSTASLYMHPSTKKITATFFDSLFRKHRPIEEDSLVFIQFGLNECGSSWSGPLCISSLGHFFVKFRKEPNTNSSSESDATTPIKSRMVQFASVHIVEEISTLVLYFHMPPDLPLPYRIENFLNGASIAFYQKDTGDPENLRAGDSVDYVWDDHNKPHKLVVQIAGVQILREINIDKISPWKPFFKSRQNKLLTLHFPANRSSKFQNKDNDQANGLELRRLGYEVYVDGLTRVIRICELNERSIEETALRPYASFRFRMSSFSINFLEDGIQEQDVSAPQAIIALRLMNLALYLLSTDEAMYLSTNIELVNVDNKWQGAPFASMIRRSQLHDSSFNKDMLHFFCILGSGNPNLKEIKRLSILLQPFDLNLDEETLMRLASFWRTSLSDSKTPSQLYYFKQFEIHPLKIRTCFLPGNPYSSYSSAQETLRSLLHTVVKVPSVKNTIIKLNGILLNHALLTKRELIIKCAQHYSWYAVRAVYIAKGSPLLPPAIASVFDDSASSVLDVFFDPSSGSIDIPGFTLGMFKFVNKYANSKDFSGTNRYLGDLSITMKKAGSSVLFATITEISDSILRGAETDGFNGLINGFHQGVLRLAMEPSLIGEAVMHGGPDRKIVLDQSPGSDELYIEGYLQAMLHVTYNQEYLQVKVFDNLVQLKNLPPNSVLIDEIMDNVKSFLVSQGLLKGDNSTSHRPLRHLRGEREWSVGPMVLTLGEHLFVSFAIRLLRTRADEFLGGLRDRRETASGPSDHLGQRPGRIWAVGRFVLSGVFAYVDGLLCRRIPNPIARRIVSGFLLTFLEKKDKG